MQKQWNLDGKIFTRVIYLPINIINHNKLITYQRFIKGHFYAVDSAILFQITDTMSLKNACITELYWLVCGSDSSIGRALVL